MDLFAQLDIIAHLEQSTLDSIHVLREHSTIRLAYLTLVCVPHVLLDHTVISQLLRNQLVLVKLVTTAVKVQPYLILQQISVRQDSFVQVDRQNPNHVLREHTTHTLGKLHFWRVSLVQQGLIVKVSTLLRPQVLAVLGITVL